MEERMDDRLDRLRMAEGAVAVQLVISPGGYGIAAPDFNVETIPAHRKVLLLEGLSMIALAINAAPISDDMPDGPIKTAAMVARERDERLKRLLGGVAIEQAVRGQA